MNNFASRDVAWVMHPDDPTDRDGVDGAGGGQDRYPGYDVLSKRLTPSWDALTRSVVEARMHTADDDGPRYLSPEAYAVLQALCARILPQPSDREPVPLAAYVDEKLQLDRRDGYRNAAMPPQRAAWTRGLAALDQEAQAAHGRGFATLDAASQNRLLAAMQAGDLHHPSWGDMAPALFFSDRVMADIPRAYYAHPTAWSEIGFGGPASPRGYVRMDFGKRDPWEAAEAAPGRESAAAKANARVGR